MLDAPSDVLRLHYKNMKCDVSFSQGSEVQYVGQVEIILAV